MVDPLHLARAARASRRAKGWTLAQVVAASPLHADDAGLTEATVSRLESGRYDPAPLTMSRHDRAVAMGTPPEPGSPEWEAGPQYLLASFPADDAPPEGFIGGADGRLPVCRTRALAERLADVVEGSRGTSGIAPVPVWPEGVGSLAAAAQGAVVLDASDDQDATVAAVAAFLTAWISTPGPTPLYRHEPAEADS